MTRNWGILESMRWTCLVIAAALAACTRQNPAFGVDGEDGSGSTGPTSDSTSSVPGTTDSSSGVSAGMTSSTSAVSATGDDDDPLDCEEPAFAIVVEGGVPPCPTPLASVIIECVQFSGDGGGRLVGHAAEGCVGDGQCTPIDDTDFTITVEGIDFHDVHGLADAETSCGMLELHGKPGALETCEWDMAAVWSRDIGSGPLRIALGNGPPEQLPDLARPSGARLPLEVGQHQETECGVAMGCDRAGWKTLAVGTGKDPALPDGVPVSTTFPLDALPIEPVVYNIFNWGLQTDLSCKPQGRWAVVPESVASIFD